MAAVHKTASHQISDSVDRKQFCQGDPRGSATRRTSKVPFAEQVVALIDDAARRSELGEIGRQRVQEDLSWERQSITYIDVIRRLSQRTRGNRHDEVAAGMERHPSVPSQ